MFYMARCSGVIFVLLCIILNKDTKVNMLWFHFSVKLYFFIPDLNIFHIVGISFVP